MEKGHSDGLDLVRYVYLPNPGRNSADVVACSAGTDIWVTARFPILLAIIAILYQLAVFILGRTFPLFCSSACSAILTSLFPCLLASASTRNRGLQRHSPDICKDRGDERVVQQMRGDACVCDLAHCAYQWLYACSAF
jgi:hypothetical protein